MKKEEIIQEIRHIADNLDTYAYERLLSLAYNIENSKEIKDDDFKTNSLELHYENLKDIVYDKDIHWETKYHIIFNEKISCAIINEFDIKYYDPDCSYQDNVLAFLHAVKEKLEENIN